MKITLLIVLFIFGSYIKPIAQLLPSTCESGGWFSNKTPECNENDFELVFEDNFEGNSLNLTKWWTPTGVTRNLTLDDVKVWYMPENVSVSNGTLKIKAYKFTTPMNFTFITDESTNPPTYSAADFEYTSGEIRTFQEFYHGKYEIRCKLPNGQGLFPAFWTHEGLRQSEIDIFDNKHANDTWYARTGCDFDLDGSADGCGNDINNIPDLSEWHIFTCIFDNDRIIWQLDGVSFFEYFRYNTLSGLPLYCGDEFAYNQYFQKKAYPLEKMIMILNLAILAGDDAPDETTVFPAYYEVDYIRFYKRTPCDGCIANIVYENLENLPATTRTQEYIYTQNNTRVLAGQNVSLKSPLIKLLPGTKIESGSTFKAVPQECNFFNYNDEANPQFIGSNAIDNYQIIKCIDPNYYINATGVTEYSVNIYNLQGQLVHSSSGVPSSNQIFLWNTANVADGWYTIHQELSNCTVDDPVTLDYNILVLDCRMSSIQEDSIYMESYRIEKNTQNSNKEKDYIDDFIYEKKLILYPNPTVDLLNVYYSSDINSKSKFSIYDVDGKVVFFEVFNVTYGSNFKTISLNNLSVGVYLLVAEIDGNLTREKFTISK